MEEGFLGFPGVGVPGRPRKRGVWTFERVREVVVGTSACPRVTWQDRHPTRATERGRNVPPVSTGSRIRRPRCGLTSLTLLALRTKPSGFFVHVLRRPRISNTSSMQHWRLP